MLLVAIRQDGIIMHVCLRALMQLPLPDLNWTEGRVGPVPTGSMSRFSLIDVTKPFLCTKRTRTTKKRTIAII